MYSALRYVEMREALFVTEGPHPLNPEVSLVTADPMKAETNTEKREIGLKLAGDSKLVDYGYSQFTLKFDGESEFKPKDGSIASKMNGYFRCKMDVVPIE